MFYYYPIILLIFLRYLYVFDHYDASLVLLNLMVSCIDIVLDFEPEYFVVNPFSINRLSVKGINSALLNSLNYEFSFMPFSVSIDSIILETIV